MPILPNWVTSQANATLFLSDMSKPGHGKLHNDDNNQWYFKPGNTSDPSKYIHLADFVSTCQSLLDLAQLFKGHTKFARVYQARNQVQLRTCVLRHYLLMVCHHS